MEQQAKNPFDGENKDKETKRPKGLALKYNGTGKVRINGVGEFLAGGGVRYLNGKIDKTKNELPITPEQADYFMNDPLYKIVEV